MTIKTLNLKTFILSFVYLPLFFISIFLNLVITRKLLEQTYELKKQLQLIEYNINDVYVNFLYQENILNTLITSYSDINVISFSSSFGYYGKYILGVLIIIFFIGCLYQVSFYSFYDISRISKLLMNYYLGPEVSDLNSRLLKGLKLYIGPGGDLRGFSMSDTTMIYLKSHKFKKGEIFFLSDNQVYTINEVLLDKNLCSTIKLSNFLDPHVLPSENAYHLLQIFF